MSPPWVLVPPSCCLVTSRGRWGRPSCYQDCPVKVPQLLLIVFHPSQNFTGFNFQSWERSCRHGDQGWRVWLPFQRWANATQDQPHFKSCVQQHLSTTPVPLSSVNLKTWQLLHIKSNKNCTAFLSSQIKLIQEQWDFETSSFWLMINSKPNNMTILREVLKKFRPI